MAETPKILGQLDPAADTLTDLYTVPAARAAIATVVVCNRSANATTFRISVAVAGAADDNKQYLYYNEPAEGNRSFHSIPVTLAATDVIRVYADDATLTFAAVGEEIT